jgi:tight adherence protein B
MTAVAYVALLVGAAVLVWPGSGDPGARLSGLDGSARDRAQRAGGTSSSARPARGRSEAPRWWHRSTRARPEGDLVSLLEGLAATLRAGLTPARALHHLAATQGTQGTQGFADGDALVRQLATDAAAGSPLEPVWRREARARASPALRAVAEGWALTERHGAPLVDVLDVVVGALRDAARSEAAVQTALAAPRATARLLGVLPLGGLVLGELVGVHPLSVLLGTGPGRVVGLAGLGCTLAGRVWMRRLVASVGGVSGVTGR